jgi:hypothetical protein
MRLRQGSGMQKSGCGLPCAPFARPEPCSNNRYSTTHRLDWYWQPCACIACCSGATCVAVAAASRTAHHSIDVQDAQNNVNTLLFELVRLNNLTLLFDRRELLGTSPAPKKAAGTTPPAKTEAGKTTTPPKTTTPAKTESAKGRTAPAGAAPKTTTPAESGARPGIGRFEFESPDKPPVGRRCVAHVQTHLILVTCGELLL